MFAQVIRQERLGDPQVAFKIEEMPVPTPGPNEVLISVMAAGVNYNNVWAALGVPVDVIAMRQRSGGSWDFHVGGSDAAGIICAKGDAVSDVDIGDEVVVHPGWWRPDDPHVRRGGDPMLAPSAKIWGYDAESNFGAFAQFAIAQEHQLLPKPSHLSWEEAAAAMLVGCTAYRMLYGWPPHTVKPGDVVLVWGGSGGVGTQAIQLARLAGAVPVAVVSTKERGEFAKGLGAAGYILRTQFTHWGMSPHWDETALQKAWNEGAQAFGRAIWEVVGERKSPFIVIEHPGESTIPTSVFVCQRGGMVVTCAATTGYSATLDLRHLWVSQKRLQGSHGSNDEQARAYITLLNDRLIDPCLGDVFTFHELPQAHHEMHKGTGRFGNRVIRIGARPPG